MFSYGFIMTISIALFVAHQVVTSQQARAAAMQRHPAGKGRSK
jgi:hypothetical protein